jgi:nucleoid-associated protein YgaU
MAPEVTPAPASVPEKQPPVVEKKPEKVPAVAPGPVPLAPEKPAAPVVVEEVRPEIKEEKKEVPSEPALGRPHPTEMRAGPPETAALPTGQDIVVERGDTLDKLSKKVYGRSNERVIGLIQKNNPAIRDPDFILPGQKLIFPPLPETPH